MIEIRQLRAFVTLAETLHFTRAAERLHITQPPLSRQVAGLEQALGVRLFDRHSRAVRLTPAGTRLLADARGLLAGLDQACRNAQAAARGELGELAVGFMMHAAYSSVPALARRFVADWPEVRLTLREILPSAIVGAVMAGELDAGITFTPPPQRGLASAVLAREGLCLAVPAGHGLAAGGGPVGAADLAGVPLVASPADVTPSLRQAIAAYFASAGAEPLIRLETQLQQTIVSLVAEGIGLALVPASLERLGMRGVVFRPLVAAPVVEQVLVWRQANANPALPHFLAAARALAEGAG